MVFIPNDIFDQLCVGKVRQQREVLMQYAMHTQSEGKEPEAELLADELEMELEDVNSALSVLKERGWLERVFNYSEL
jgi:DNA-directed RNA polymerase specialized sigma subunit